MRLRSKQSFTKLRRKGKEDVVVDDTGHTKDITEYVVIQRRMIEGKEGKWKIWGTTTESDTEAIADGLKVPVAD